MGFFDKLKKGLTKTRESLTGKIEKLVLGYADIDDDLLDELEETLIMADEFRTAYLASNIIYSNQFLLDANSPDFYTLFDKDMEFPTQ